MPMKFKLINRSGRRALHLQLFGEFDGSAACGLINAKWV